MTAVGSFSRSPAVRPGWPLLAGLALLEFQTGCRRATPLPTLGELPSFSLTGHYGEAVSSETLGGQVWVADFIFTRCGGICPAMTARLVRLRGGVPAAVAFVSFTVDPEHDTPEVLAAYARGAGVSGDWHFVTGSREALYALSTGGFKLAALEIPPEERVAGGTGHSCTAPSWCWSMAREGSAATTTAATRRPSSVWLPTCAC